jgi:hypothetical protein
VAAAGLVAASLTPALAHAWRGAGVQEPQDSVPLRRGAAPLVPDGGPIDGARTDGARPLAPVATQEDGAAPTLRRLDVPALLGEADLDQRERNFDIVVERAAEDEDVRAELRDLADGADRELAWSARLALRSLRAEAVGGRGGRGGLGDPTPFGRFAPFGGADPFADLERRMDELFADGFARDPFELFGRLHGASPLDDPAFRGFGLTPRRLAPRGGAQEDREDQGQQTQPIDPFEELRARMDELQRRLDARHGGRGGVGQGGDGTDAEKGSNAGPLTPVPLKPGTRGHGAAPKGFGSFHGRSQSMTLGPDGVRVEVTEDGPGGRTTRTYEAKTLEELYEMHPELKGR